MRGVRCSNALSPPPPPPPAPLHDSQPLPVMPVPEPSVQSRSTTPPTAPAPFGTTSATAPLPLAQGQGQAQAQGPADVDGNDNDDDDDWGSFDSAVPSAAQGLSGSVTLPAPVPSVAQVWAGPGVPGSLGAPASGRDSGKSGGGDSGSSVSCASASGTGGGSVGFGDWDAAPPRPALTTSASADSAAFDDLFASPGSRAPLGPPSVPVTHSSSAASSAGDLNGA